MRSGRDCQHTVRTFQRDGVPASVTPLSPPSPGKRPLCHLRGQFGGPGLRGSSEHTCCQLPPRPPPALARHSSRATPPLTHTEATAVLMCLVLTARGECSA